MAVNKNFVVKNGLEVNTNLLLADADNSRVGVGTSVPSFTLHVFGGIGVTDVSVTGVTTLSQDLKVGSGGTGFVVTTDSATGAGQSVGIRTGFPEYTLDVRGPVSTGATALYVQGDARITGDLFVDDITFDDANMQDLTVTDTLTVAGVTTLASGGGISTVGGQLYVASDISAIGVITATSFTGLGQIGVASEGTFVGTGVTLVDFKTTTGTNINSVDISSGIASVTIQPGVSLGLAIALGG
tara:strand:- start:827 stop:1552 length:726 start_codon:yes stop_codon:yes gene_type:complete